MKTKILKTGILAILLAIFISGCTTPSPNIGGDSNKAASINDLEICVSKTPITLNKDTLSEIMEKNKNLTLQNKEFTTDKKGSPLEAMVDIGSSREGVLVDENGKNIEINCYNPAPKSKKPFADCVVYTIGSNDGAISINSLNKDTFYVDSAFDVLDKIGLSNVKNDKDRWIPEEYSFKYKTKDISVEITDIARNSETSRGQTYNCTISFPNEESAIVITLSKLNKEMAGVLSKEEIKETDKLKITQIGVAVKIPTTVTRNRVSTMFSQAPTTSISLGN